MCNKQTHMTVCQRRLEGPQVGHCKAQLKPQGKPRCAVHDFPGDAAGIVDSVGRLVVEYRCDAGDGIMIFNGRVFGS